MTGSKVPAAIDALLALVTRAVAAAPPVVGVAAVQAFEADPVTTDPDFVAVGYSGPESEAVSRTSAIVDAGLRSNTEQFDIHSLISCWRGDPDIKIPRDRAFAILELIESAIVADSKLGGAVARAHIAESLYTPTRLGGKGPIAELTFTVRCEAWR